MKTPRFVPRIVFTTAVVGVSPACHPTGRGSGEVIVLAVAGYASGGSAGTGGAATNPKYKRALMECIPHVMIIEGYGSSETGNMAFGYSHQGTASQTFEPRFGATVVSADRTRFLRPGEREIGWAARTGRIPLGYFNDAEATQRTFPEVEGQRVVIPGDRASLEEDGSIRLLGRDSLVVNTGGEKVFVEEVEDVLKQHDAVVDALVTGRPHERFGQEVVAIVQLDGTATPAASPTGADLRDWCGGRLARYKAPRAFVFVELIKRHASGKADYRWAGEQATAAVEVV